MLRDYQKRAIDQLYQWFEQNPKGNPCLVLPTGAGKSHIVAAICKEALQQWPETRVLMLTHVKELIAQNAQKMRDHWANAPLGIYSSGLRKFKLGEPITFAGIQSVRNRASEIGFIDLIIIDECHLCSHKNEGGYRKLINELTKINPALRVIGLSATPYRLGHGYITTKPAIFDDLIEPVTIEELVYKGFLAPLRSKITESKLSTDGVHKRGGEFIESELQKAVDTSENNSKCVSEIIKFAENRKAWLLFCSGVQHAEHVKDEFLKQGILAMCITGDTPSGERDSILAAFKRGEIRAITNANVLTTGFDYPDIDLIAMMRPTMSTALYVQMAGRGMRPKSHTDHCLVLDFAGVVEEHGPVTAVQPKEVMQIDQKGKAPTKKCAHCGEICHAAVRICTACGAEFPEPEKAPLVLNKHVDIMGESESKIKTMGIVGWLWRKHISRSSGNVMLMCTYYGSKISDEPVKVYYPIFNDGYAGERARRHIKKIINESQSEVNFQTDSMDEIAEELNGGLEPGEIIYMKDGNFFKILDMRWG